MTGIDEIVDVIVCLNITLNWPSPRIEDAGRWVCWPEVWTKLNHTATNLRIWQAQCERPSTSKSHKPISLALSNPHPLNWFPPRKENCVLSTHAGTKHFPSFQGTRIPCNCKILLSVNIFRKFLSLIVSNSSGVVHLHYYCQCADK